MVGFYTNAQGLTLGFQGQPQANAVPEPGGVGLTLLALTLAACARRRTRR
ncbi:MAG: PEP-CTERM sorting domain-containing protein [Burkholderiales bacterium]|nr:PEP-CTERM sorting domain-containing protein [Burkholderiales bacterium]